jgi:4-amino-4-deoxy-L-arabinose transferase-like glycosyltransferase
VNLDVISNNLNSLKTRLWEKPDTEWFCKAFLLVLLAGLIISIFILSCVPPVSRDALTHHLAVPKLYLKHGGIYQIPFIQFSYFPMNLDLLYLISLYFGSDIIPKYIHFAFALLTAFLIFSYLKKRIGLHYGLLGAVLFLSTPIIARLSITVYVDLGLIFFSAGSLLLLLRWVESGFEHRFLALSAVCCGLAMGTKYNGLITFFLLTLFVPFIYSRYSKDNKSAVVQPLQYGALFFTISLLVFSPWMIRNYMWTGNPLYPLYDGWFNMENPIHSSSIGLFTYRSLVYQEEWWQIALLPIRVFFQGQDGDPQYFDGRLNPFLLLLPLFAISRIGKESDTMRMEVKVMVYFSLLFFAFAFFSSGLRVRYISPIIPPLVIVSIFGLRRIVLQVRALRIRLLRDIGLAGALLIICFALWMNFRYIADQYAYIDPFSYLGGTVSRAEYIERYRSEFPAMQYINEKVPLDARILFLFMGKRGYYCDRAYIFDMNNSRSMIKEFLKASHSAEDLLVRIQGSGITHLLIHYRIFDRWVRETFTAEEQKYLREFFHRHVRLLYSKGGYGLLCLEDLMP